PFTQPVKEILIIHNPNHEPVSFRIKTTAPKQYAVRPNMGRIEPNQKVEIQFILCPMKEDPSLDFKCKDKFKIQSIGITPEHKTLSLQELWAITSEDLIKEKKIQCVYLPPVANNLLPTLAVNDSIPIERNSSTSYVDNNLDFSKLTLIDHPDVNDKHITHGEESDVDKNDSSNEMTMQFINMGFPKAQAIDALEQNNHDPYKAITYLLDLNI
ncbi:23736_t:CDS:2, partial [Gigaspora rosea]